VTELAVVDDTFLCDAEGDIRGIKDAFGADVCL
jgi:hypothetical protein